MKLPTILYSTDCPKCVILEQKLNEKQVTYTKEKDKRVMIKKGIMSAPVLSVDGKLLDFSEAIDWVNT
jgi:glutaredoxin